MDWSEQEPSGGSQSVSSAKTNKFSSSEMFPDIRYTRSFIDKSLLILELLQETKNDPVVLVTAPRRIGKSVNLSMVQHFLEKQVDKLTGEEIPQDREGSNLSLFKELKIMEPAYKKLQSMHFGKYAVLKANFFCPIPIRTVQDALQFCKDIIHEAFKEHYYLCNSTKLQEDQKIVCKEWCHNRRYLNKNNDLVADGLKVLSYYLWLHYERKVKIFVTIDEYDSFFNMALSDVKDRRKLEDIINHNISLVANLVTGNEYVAGAFLTGISHLSGLGLSSALGLVSTYRFLRKSNKFNGYYGFTKDEVKQLFEEFEVSDDDQDMFKQFYNGYQSEDGVHCIYNTWSVVKYFQEKSYLDSYWVRSGAIKGLSSAFKIDTIKADIEKAIMSFDGVANITPLDKCDMDHFFQLHSLCGDETSKDKNYAPTSGLFFTFLLDQGYFTYAGVKILKIPNKEVKKELQGKLEKHFRHLYSFYSYDDFKCMNAFQKIFDTMSVDSEKLQELKKSLEQFVVPLQQIRVKDHSILQQALFIPLFKTGFNYCYCSEICTLEDKKPDCFLFKQDIAAIIEVKYMSTDSDSHNNSENALKQILERYCSLFADTDTYLSNIPKNCLLLGLSFNRELKLSIHCLESCKTSKINLHSNAALSKESVNTLIGEAIAIPFC